MTTDLPGQLPRTGASTTILVGIGLWFIVGGAVAMLLGKLIKGTK